MTSIRTETETVIKKILPYLRRREYDAETDLDFETAVKNPVRYQQGYVDILVTCGKPKPMFLLEAKRSSKRLTDKDRKQALTYGTALKVPFVVVANGSDIQCFNTRNGEAIRWNGKLIERVPTKSQLGDVIRALKANPELTNVPLGNDKSLPFRPALTLKQLNALFYRCHSAIRDNEKDEDHAFADFSKLLFLKLLEEKADSSEFKLPYSYRFHELAQKTEAEADQIQDAINEMVEKIKQKTTYGDVLETPLFLKKAKTWKLAIELAGVSFQDSSLDYKGAAFEYFVRATLKGKRLGQYFTPRPLIRLMSSLVGRQKVVNALLAGESVRVTDPACGTGGFLVYSMRDGLRQLDDLYNKKKITGRARDQVGERLMRKTFFGADANPGVACAAKMNMIVAGDGHSNIQCEDSLARASTIWSVDHATNDLILTNPPFGMSEAESLNANDLAAYPIRSTKGQHLFLQKMVLSTVAQGEICTVIDEGLLNTDTAADLRKWLFQKCEVLAVVRLPEETFKPNKINVKASVLFLRRRAEDDLERELDYDVSFIEIASLGYTGFGDIRGFDLEKLLSEIDEASLDHSTPVRSGYEWKAFDIRAQEIVKDGTARLDYKYWEVGTRARIDTLVQRSAPTIANLNQIKTDRGKSPPAETYVDEKDGYAMVVKAGSNISRFGELIPDGADYVEKNTYDELADSCKLQRGDVLLASTGDGVLGKACVYQQDSPAVADGHVTIIRLDPKVILPEYLADYLRVGFGRRQIERLYTGSTGLIELTPESVARIVVDLLAGTPEQQRASADLRRAEFSYQDTLATAENALQEARHAYEASMGSAAK